MAGRLLLIPDNGAGRLAQGVGLQITEHCNLHCAHCHVSTTRYGDTLELAEIEGQVVPQLARAAGVYDGVSTRRMVGGSS